jgi:two-component system LytT family sensor kinase
MGPERSTIGAAARRAPPVWMLVSAAWIGPAILAAFQAYVQGRLGNRPPADWRTLLWEGGDWLIYALLTPAVFVVARRFPPVRTRMLRFVAVHLAAAILLCAAWATAGVLLGLVLFPAGASPTGNGLAGWFLTSLPFGVAVYFAVLGVERAATYFLEARERETQAARLAAQLAEGRFDALRAQLQPHFLLNSLNAITVIVRDRDSATATRMLEHLGEMLRRVMRGGRRPEVPLGEELEFVRQLLAIEELRFSDRLKPVFRVDPALLGAAVPEFVLQPLVENALQHGLARSATATRLEIEARREGAELVLVVTDDGPGAGTEGRQGVGLTNTRARLATLHGERASVVLGPTAEGGTAATIRLPYRELEEHADG